jgi:hypothetical protein
MAAVSDSAEIHLYLHCWRLLFYTRLSAIYGNFSLAPAGYKYLQSWGKSDNVNA